MEDIPVAQTHHASVVLSAGAVDVETGSLTGKVKFNIEHMMLSGGHGPYIDKRDRLCHPE